MKRILIVEDEKDIAEAIEYNLAKEGFRVLKAYDGRKGMKIAQERLPDLLILDLMLPGMDGLDVCKTLKSDPKTSDIPIVMLTAKSEELDKVLGLELGADDYITKPFSMRELMARVKTILRRYEEGKPSGGESVVKFESIIMDINRHELKVSDKAVELTAKEFALLRFLIENRGRVFSRERLLDDVWGVEVAIETRTVDVHVRNLREKLGRSGKHIRTIRGVGYKFE